MKFKGTAVAVLAATVSMVGCDSSGMHVTKNSAVDGQSISSGDMSDAAGVDNIINTASAAGGFETLLIALKTTGLDAVLADENGSFTVFAPTDEAFAKLGDDTLTALLNDKETLSDILLYHVLTDAVVPAATAVTLDGKTVAAANGDEFAVTLQDNDLFINDAQVIAADVMASNGIIHAIDTVLIPPASDSDAAVVQPTIVEKLQATGNFNTLVAALQATGLDATLMTDGPFTLFAPDDNAFKKLGTDTVNSLLATPDVLSDILLYHVIGGQSVDATTAISLAGNDVETANGDTIALDFVSGKVFINNSEVTQADIGASNGIIHVIDTVLTPPSDTHADPSTQPANVFDALAPNGLTTLASAIEKAELVDALSDTAGQFTVFAPTNAAFDALGAHTLNALLHDKHALQAVLLRHVVGGAIVDSEAVMSLLGQPVDTLAEGQSVTVTAHGHDLFVNGAKIVLTDITADNGIIHVIDAVIPEATH